jgi:hypothetical protein
MSYKRFTFKLDNPDLDKIYALVGEAKNYESYDLAIQLMLENLVNKDYQDFCKYNGIENSREISIGREDMVDYDEEILEYNKINKFLQWLPSFIELQNKIPYVFKLMINRGGGRSITLNFGSVNHAKFSQETYASFVEKLSVLEQLSPLIEYPSQYIVFKVNYLVSRPF